MFRIQFWRILVFVVVIMLVTVEGSEKRVQAAIGYDRNAARQWAWNNNPDDSCEFSLTKGDPLGPDECPYFSPGYIYGTLQAGGLPDLPLDPRSPDPGNRADKMTQIEDWMIDHQDAWGFVNSIDQLLPGDFVMFSNEPISQNDNNWMDAVYLHGAVYIGLDTNFCPDDLADPFTGPFGTWNSDVRCKSFNYVNIDENGNPHQYTRYVRILSEAIGDLVWEDVNANGSQDGNDVGVAGIPLSLLNVNGDILVEQGVSDANGILIFDFDEFSQVPSITGSSYIVSVQRDTLLSMGYDLDTQGENSEFDSDFNQVTGRTEPIDPEATLVPITIQPNTRRLDIDLGLIRIPECLVRRDIMVVLDSSKEIADKTPLFWQRLWSLMLFFVEDIARSFIIGPEDTRLGIVQINATGHGGVSLFLQQSRNIQYLSQSIRQIPQITTANATDIAAGLSFAYQELTRNSRPGVRRSIVVISEGTHNEQRGDGRPQAVASAIKAAGIDIVFVQYMPNPVDIEYARNLVLDVASDPNQYYAFTEIGDREDLIRYLKPVVDIICTPYGSAPVTTVYNTSTPTLTWMRPDFPANEIIGYEIVIGPYPNSTGQNNFTVSVDAPITSFTIQTPLAQGHYFWQVRGKRQNNQFTGWSPMNEFLIDLP